MVLATSMSQALRASMRAWVCAFSSVMVAMVSLRVRGFLKHTAHQRQVLGFGEWCLIICLDHPGMVRPIGEQIYHCHGHGFGGSQDTQLVVLDEVVTAVTSACGGHDVGMDDRHELGHITHVRGAGAMPERRDVGLAH